MSTLDKDREYAYVNVTGYRDYSEITGQFNMEPSKAWNAGEQKPRGGQYPRSEWKFESGLPDTEELISHIDILLTLLEQRSDAVRNLSPEWDIHINCVGYYSSSQHGFHLGREVIKRAAYLGIEFDFDLYYVASDENDG